MRYDAHNAPFAGTQSQWSPRVRLNFYPNSANTLYLYYGRLFLPTNVEDLRAITSVAQGGAASAGRVPVAARVMNTTSASVSWLISLLMSFLPDAELRRRDEMLVRRSRCC